MKTITNAFKRIIDLTAVILSSPISIPLIILLALIIRLSSGRGVFFCQERAGKDMVPFTLYKFRTMKNDCDPYGNSPKDGADPRLTWIGKWLRILSLDELPQLLNVLKGDMSLVGPRPLYMSQAAEWNERQKRRLEVKPGLTGLAQISGRGSLTIEEKLELDVQYVERKSLLFDLRLLISTALKMFAPQDIYEKRYSKSEKTRQKKH